MQTPPVQLNPAAPAHHADPPRQYPVRKSSDFDGIDAPPGPTGTDIPPPDNSPHTSPFQDIPPGRFPGQSPYASTAVLGGVDNGAPREVYESENVHGRDGLRTERVSHSSDRGLDRTRTHSTGSSRKSSERPRSSERRRSEGHPGGGPLEGEKLPCTGIEKPPSPKRYVKSTGVAADGGDFDAAKPGAGREAERLMDMSGIHHGADLKPSPAAKQNHSHLHHHEAVHHEAEAPHQEAPVAHQDAAAQAEHERHKAGLAEKLKEKLHLSH